MEIPFVGGAYEGRSKNLNAQKCQNLYPVGDKQEGKKVLALYGTPGLTRICQPANGEVRGAVNVSDFAFVVIGNAVYKVTLGGAYTAQTGNLLTATGKVWMENNGAQVMITDGIYGYILTGGTVTRITDADFPTPSSLTYQDGYFIVSKAESGQFQISDSYDGTSWDALMYATAESDPDNLVSVVSCRKEIWLLGSRSYEVWYNSGNADFPFDRVQGSQNQVGCGAAGSAASGFGYLAWMDNTRSIRASKGGYEAQRISTDQIDYQLAQYVVVGDANAFIYAQEGHIFYQLTFPTERKTWVFDFITGFWHTRASGLIDDRSRANCCAMVAGVPVVGDFTNGKIYRYDLDKFTDDGETIRAVRRAQAVHKDRKNVFHGQLEVELEAGVGLAVNDPDLATGTNPQALLKWSDDGGHTWSNEHWRKIGKIGEYKNRAIWRGLGCSRERIYELTISDPVKRVILGAHLEAEAGID
jgi:hypothetical protein